MVLRNMDYMTMSKEDLLQELNKLQSENEYLQSTYRKEIELNKHTEAELRKSNQKLEAIISASPDGIGMITLDGKIQLIMSKKLPEMYGYSIDEKDMFVGKPVFDFIDPSSHKNLIDNIHKLLADKNDDRLTEYVAVRKDKSKFYIDVNSTILFDSAGKPESILFIERDITERKLAEKEIFEKNLKLAELNAAKDKFFSIIAHDLKNPFHGLIGYSEILLTNFNHMPDNEKISFITRIKELSQNTHKLLENLLEWSKIQIGQLNINMERFNISNELQPTLSLAKQTASLKDINFNFSIDNSIYIESDKNILTSIVRNIISNSIKFTHKGGKVDFNINNLDNYVEFIVSDTGIGIDNEKLNRLFKIDNSIIRDGTANEKGTGLGLMLSKELLDKLGGIIKVKSSPNIGTTFSFNIPQKN